MKGSIKKMGDGIYKLRVEAGRDGSGKRQQRAKTVHMPLKEAQRELARLVREMEDGIALDARRVSVAEFLARWLGDSAKYHVSARTFERYEAIIRLYLAPSFTGLALAKLTPLHIEKCLADARAKGLAPATVKKVYNVLRAALQQAVRWRFIGSNPADAVTPPKVKKKDMQVLSEAETAHLLHVAEGTRAYLPVLVAVTSGMRRGEILGLSWRDVDLAAGTLSVTQVLEETSRGVKLKEPKTPHSRRCIPLPAVMVQELKKHRAKQAEQLLASGSGPRDMLVFTTIDGAPWRPSNFERAFHTLKRKAGFPTLRFHDLRHGHATQLMRQGVHPKVVQERLGHSSISVTLDTYSHVMPGMQEDAVQRFNELLVAALEQ